MNKQLHWNNIFKKNKNESLGWWESDISQTLKFLDNIDINNESRIFLAGAGTSLLVDELVLKTSNLILNDISEVVLEKLKDRLQNGLNLEFFLHDLSKPFFKDNIDIWIDRAVLHFLTKEEDIKTYFKNLNNNLHIGSFVLFAQFRVGGATSCASLNIKQYDTNEFSQRLGEKFKLISNEEYNYINPFGGQREYIYALYQKTI
jgi:hypothetical protein